MLKKVLFTIVFLCVLLTPTQALFAQEEKSEPVNIYFFWGTGCPHCEKEKEFLNILSDKYSDVHVLDYEVWGNRGNLNLMVNFAKTLGVDVQGVPFTVIGEHYIIGWLSEEHTGVQIEEAIDCARENGCKDLGKGLLVKEDSPIKGATSKRKEKREVKGIPETMNLPIVGEVETKNFSLPMFTVVLGVLDGFNPCAMWTLVFLISLLLGLKDRKRMWILGSVFIFASAFVYFLFMVAWLNFILFIGMVNWVRVLIGLIALGAGGYSVREYIVNRDGKCKVTDKEKRQKIFHRLKEITQKQSFWLAIGGIILLAFAVNLVEAICSAGLPAIYTQILTLNNLSKTEYYLYILLYIFFFMLDDLVVFIVAMTTLRMTGTSKKYNRISSLVGGILMLIIGVLLIFKPEWLMFG